MTNLKDITKSLKNIHYGTALRPSRDWLVLLVCTFVFMLVSVAWNLWMFGKVTSGQSIGTETAQRPVHTAPIEAVTKLFESRAAEEARYKTDYRFVDPSVKGR
jgi:hypothetical protein